MDKERLERSWQTVVHQAKRVWGNMLTEEVVDSARTHSEQLLAALHHHLSGAKAALRDKIKAWRR